ncbi:hypothetical protein HYPSUDRAFT_39619 [Hypholoma sublateritium FD-334 SS-4]|uniref:Uncharacterized protein n=1 Tax=Hypholoma sublateritium (strain FD-334 SS-4) TaxID=945553 RepID=A0A0D2P566_HYPSF|nr:hypothetical protein HYPSUDRAFT_39619 [Hypholoma sublateritium FD-334 SS-4]
MHATSPPVIGLWVASRHCYTTPRPRCDPMTAPLPLCCTPLPSSLSTPPAPFQATTAGSGDGAVHDNPAGAVQCAGRRRRRFAVTGARQHRRRAAWPPLRPRWGPL